MMIVMLDKNPELYELSIRDEKQFFKKTKEEQSEADTFILNELRDELNRIGINPGYQNSMIGTPDASGWGGGLCLHEEDGYWLVYHSERGNRRRPNVFTTVQAAANYFLWFHVCRPDGGNSDVGMLPRISHK